MKKIALILTIGLNSFILNANNTDTNKVLIEYKTGHEREVTVYKTCDNIVFEVHKLIKVKPNNKYQFRLLKVEGYKLSIKPHICKL